MIWAALAVAGGMGAICRFLVDGWVTRASRTGPGLPPLGTAVVNVSACLLLGIAVGALGAVPGGGDAALVLGTGLLGGYSTFSTAAVEAARLLTAGRWGAAVMHAGLMTLATLVAATLGLTLGQALGAGIAAQ